MAGKKEGSDPAADADIEQGGGSGPGGAGTGAGGGPAANILEPALPLPPVFGTRRCALARLEIHPPPYRT